MPKLSQPGWTTPTSPILRSSIGAPTITLPKQEQEFTFSPTLYTDLGWRWNQRNLEDNRVRDYSSTYFDGAVTWRPSPFFLLTASIQRTIGEPTMQLALLSDIRSYEVKMTYLPVAGVAVSIAAAKQLINEIGAGTSYDADVINATLSYDYSAHMQVYTALRYEYYSFDWQNPRLRPAPHSCRYPDHSGWNPSASSRPGWRATRTLFRPGASACRTMRRSRPRLVTPGLTCLP